MPELLRLQTAQFELSIWSNDITRRQRVYQTTLSKRVVAHSQNEAPAYFSQIRFSPPLSIVECSNEAALHEPLSVLQLNPPLFFENAQYQFEWIFFNENGKVDSAKVAHGSHLINEGFHFAKARPSIPARLTGSINTDNNVGWMRLPVEYVIAGRTFKSDIAFEVLPTKMDLHRDLPAMYQTIDTQFPLWRFSLLEKTEQDSAQSRERGHFPLLWLANFGHLRSRFERGLKVITQAPHSRLQAHVSYAKADRLKGRLPYRLGVKVKEDLASGLHHVRYRVEKKKLSVDTPENRFIKMVAFTCRKSLAEFECRLRLSNQVPNKQRLSDAFLDELHDWQKPLQRMLGQSFLKEVGEYTELTSESLVLQQKTGYSAVDRKSVV